MSETLYSLSQASFKPRAYAVWTRTAASQPWKFHTAYTSKGKAEKSPKVFRTCTKLAPRPRDTRTRRPSLA